MQGPLIVCVGMFSESTHPGAGVVYKLLLAIGQPQRITFLQCGRIGATDRGWNSRHYQYEGMQILDHVQIPFAGLNDIMIIPQMLCRDSSVYAVGLPVSLTHFARFHQVPSPAAGVSRSSSGRRGGAIDLDMLEQLQNEFPWLSLQELADILKAKTGSTTSHPGSAPNTSGPGSGSTSSASGSASRTSSDTDIAEDLLAAAAAELSSLKEQLKGFEEETGSWFTIRVLGGIWSMERSRQSCTDIGAYARDKSTHGHGVQPQGGRGRNCLR